MQQISLADNLNISPIVHGLWRLAEWNLSSQETLRLLESTIELGITTYDHADIYGNYTCEKLFGDALKLDKSLRQDIQLVSKCGIKLVSDKFPERQVKYYDYTSAYIIESVENSLAHFGTDYIDLLLLHRPSPFFNAEEVAGAFEMLRSAGKVLQFGVSNFSPMQFDLLSTFVDEPLVTNQVEISPYCLEHFQNGNIEYFQKHGIRPMAWSPLAGGELLNPATEKGQRLLPVLKAINEELGCESVATLVYAWILKHPSGAIPIVGSGKLSRIKDAVDAETMKMSLEQWFRIYIASLGEDVA